MRVREPILRSVHFEVESSQPKSEKIKTHVKNVFQKTSLKIQTYMSLGEQVGFGLKDGSEEQQEQSRCLRRKVRRLIQLCRAMVGKQELPLLMSSVTVEESRKLKLQTNLHYQEQRVTSFHTLLIFLWWLFIYLYIYFERGSCYAGQDSLELTHLFM